ncbi:MAG: transketolase [Verrucomicrobia bacterium]|nr:transketolase [Verrucomicrobiota bacterium]
MPRKASTESQSSRDARSGVPDIELLLEKSHWLRRELFQMVSTTRKGHIPSCYSCNELLVSLFYGGVLRYRKGQPEDSSRDRIIVSKGHAAMALYPILADIGYIPTQELTEFTKKDALLRMYADPSIPGVDAISGSLGHGLGIAAGMAFAARSDGRSQRAFVILGDSECYEGSVWESAFFASHQGLDNLVAIVDRNGLAIMGRTEELMRLGSLEEKFRSFGWEAVTVDGHSHSAILGALGRLGQTGGKPLALIANTVKGKGISYMEGRSEWHNKMPDAAQTAQAWKDLETNCISS